MRFTEFQRGVRRRASRFIAPKPSGADEPPASYYPQQPSCQIPHLHYLYTKFLGERAQGTFVEVGAYDGVFVSNSWGLAERGWRGVMVEPVPHMAAKCRQNHAGHPAVSVVECAIGADGPSEVTLRLGDTLTSANAEAFQEYRSVDWAVGVLTHEEIVVRSQTLDQLLAEQDVAADFDVLVVDVEGFEAQVFAGFDVGHWRPKMLIVELADTHPDLWSTANSDAKLGKDIRHQGYVVVFKDQINTVFVREDVWGSAYGRGDAVNPAVSR